MSAFDDWAFLTTQVSELGQRFSWRNIDMSQIPPAPDDPPHACVLLLDFDGDNFVDQCRGSFSRYAFANHFYFGSLGLSTYCTAAYGGLGLAMASAYVIELLPELADKQVYNGDHEYTEDNEDLEDHTYPEDNTYPEDHKYSFYHNYVHYQNYTEDNYNRHHNYPCDHNYPSDHNYPCDHNYSCDHNNSCDHNYPYGHHNTADYEDIDYHQNSGHH
ncbi:hypothetical protein MRX96_056167 [Rhipicephalus microplus]